ncbi:hypothetical protein AVEN_213713-1 [Araneus ventricosus]|uniref:Uncharacterized protein n=1 Tax=Araneus ventricosus TaxID=182803 RepID=A0A4Y2GLL6_ARAVE|nr:hypothetical protein AVEN_213713-1 [Araneus ventricosus]
MVTQHANPRPLQRTDVISPFWDLEANQVFSLEVAQALSDNDGPFPPHLSISHRVEEDLYHRTLVYNNVAQCVHFDVTRNPVTED